MPYTPGMFDNMPSDYTAPMKRAHMHGTPSQKLLDGLKNATHQNDERRRHCNWFDFTQIGTRVRLMDRKGFLSSVNTDGRGFEVTFDDGEVSWLDLCDSNVLIIEEQKT